MSYIDDVEKAGKRLHDQLAVAIGESARWQEECEKQQARASQAEVKAAELEKALASAHQAHGNKWFNGDLCRCNHCSAHRA